MHYCSYFFLNGTKKTSLSLFHLNKRIIHISSLLYLRVLALYTYNIARYTVYIYFLCYFQSCQKHFCNYPVIDPHSSTKFAKATTQGYLHGENKNTSSKRNSPIRYIFTETYNKTQDINNPSSSLYIILYLFLDQSSFNLKI